ncbi:D-2-hydroxyacid dehydrogenase [Salinimonas sp. HHU 13199]|uniref:D-2-hydroxyacid dehydrogenase n=1 Tax=Salinimonas profundi TaxID=2729140 RepID=A0ABR8LKA7_9ALTE|nr:D-2-hydroxyacid dehydrogenase [Salinimonas profundi]MBD3585765.1 D-2-hydroxyacid dehydrogenase [Salinimonas profundi]
MKGVILDMASLKPDDLDLTSLEALPVSWTYFDNTPAEKVNARIDGAQIILTNKVVLKADNLKDSQCRYIGVLATGMNNVDTDYCQDNGISVANVEGYGTGSVVQHALMLLLNLTTSFLRYNQAVKASDWQHAEHFCLLDYPISELRDKHLVIVGSGQLGSGLARVCQALGMRVSFSARPGSNDDPRPPLNDLLSDADVVSLHCPATPDTENLIDKAALDKMKSSAFLINTARGTLVDEHALAEALRSGSIAGAGLDVLSTEPPSSENPLLAEPLDNLIITPHSAWGATESRQRLLDKAVTNIKQFLQHTT